MVNKPSGGYTTVFCQNKDNSSHPHYKSVYLFIMYVFPVIYRYSLNDDSIFANVIPVAWEVECKQTNKKLST